MLQFLVQGEMNDTLFNFPTKVEELQDNYLKQITDHVTVADHHSLIGIVYKESISAVIMGRQQKKKAITASIIPIFIKCGNTDDEFIKSIELKDALLIATSDLSLSYHVSAPKNKLSIDHFIRLVEKDPSNVYNRSLQFSKQPVLFLDFKIVPNNAIKSAYKKKDTQIDEIYVETKEKK